MQRLCLAAVALAACLCTCAALRAPELTMGQHHNGRSPHNNDVNDRPIIGIMSQPGEPAPPGKSYIAASYVKWVESAGARAVPIFFDMDADEVRDRFRVINGLLLPGGGANLTPGHKFYDTEALLVQMAIEANKNGDYFPVHGTCLGMESLSHVISGNYSILSDFNAEDAPAALLYTSDAEDSHFIKSLPADVAKNLQNLPIAMENHGKGLSMAAYEENPKLKEFFKVLSLSIDKSGNPYISTIEAREFPITATQWHPEKNAFEWTPTLHIPHSRDAVRMSQEVANFFVAEARRNMHKAKNQIEEDDVLIYNWLPHFTGKTTGSGLEEKDFEQAYFFDVLDPKTKPPPGTEHSSVAAQQQRQQQQQQDGDVVAIRANGAPAEAAAVEEGSRNRRLVLP